MKRFSLFSRYGVHWLFLSGALTLISGFQWGWLIALPGILITILLAVIFYDPDQELPSCPLGVMNPVDGKVLFVDNIHDPFVGRKSCRIRIKASLIRPYYSRSPAEGKVYEFWPKLIRSYLPYRNRMVKGVWWIQTDEGDDVVMLVMSGMPFVRARCMIQAGERIGQARRCGRFPVICQVDILVDETVLVAVNPGDMVKAGIDVLATFNHDNISETG